MWGIKTDYDEYSWNPALTGALESGLSGKAPSQAETLRRKAFDEAMRRAMGIVRSNRAQPAAMGTRQALQAQSQLQTEGAQQASTLRAQEYQQAVANMLAQQQSAQQGYYQNQAMEQQANMANAQAQQQITGSIMNMVGGMGQAAMGAFGSDKRIKKDIKNAKGKDMDEFMSVLRAKTYKYKKGAVGGDDNSDGEVGIIAQDLEKTKLGKHLVTEVKNYKVDETGKAKEAGSTKMIRAQAIGAALAGLGHLATKVKQLEDKSNKGGRPGLSKALVNKMKKD